jgi:hypothetical protein
VLLEEDCHQKKEKRLRCCFAETLKMFQALLVVVVEDILLSLVKNKGSKTTEKFMGTIEKLYSERKTRLPWCPRVRPVGSTALRALLWAEIRRRCL